MFMDTTNSSRELHLTVANEDYLECMVRIESEDGETGGVRSVDIAQRLASRRHRSTRRFRLSRHLNLSNSLTTAKLS